MHEEQSLGRLSDEGEDLSRAFFTHPTVRACVCGGAFAVAPQLRPRRTTTEGRRRATALGEEAGQKGMETGETAGGVGGGGEAGCEKVSYWTPKDDFGRIKY